MTTRKKVLLVGAPIAALVVVLFAVKLGHRTSTTDQPVAAQKKHRPLFFPPLPRELTPDPPTAEQGSPTPAPAPGPHEMFSDSFDYAKAIADTPEFKAFAGGAKLTGDQQRDVSHIVALYYMDDASLKNATTDAEKLASMRRQLLVHMHVRVRAKIPASWAAFEQSKLLPPVEPEPAKTGTI